LLIAGKATGAEDDDVDVDVDVDVGVDVAARL